ncbi:MULTISPECIES: LLM class flavin-dependent oxidoreductase [Catenuloplanes]|uniref:F420-dependent oxidoreductase-like protein n=1 Tax=Catenuloplanes niger TaxID=587534 RepID=A0AAE3ZXY6_9ACTN|nr:LLM class flavin-dependent oxidoreductase [Catenuloplanes niger]MDR7327249.1 F420-dependent oxidoreductase-like protein [Catenuloplanes niger]
MRIGTALLYAATPADTVAAAADAARRGLDSFWTNQMAGGWDPLTLLAGLRERPAEIGTAVVLTYPRHPVTMASEALTLQAAGGGLTLGVGPGHAWYVEHALGLPYTSPLRHTREYLTALRPLLHGEPARLTGEFVTVDTALDISAPAPPVLLAALGPKMLRVAHDLADGVVATWVTPEIVAERLVPSQPPGARIVVSLVTVLTTDPDAARERIARDFGAAGELPAYAASLRRAGLTGIADTVAVGDESVIAAAVDRLRDAGATDVVLIPSGDPAARARTLDVVTRSHSSAGTS